MGEAKVLDATAQHRNVRCMDMRERAAGLRVFAERVATTAKPHRQENTSGGHHNSDAHNGESSRAENHARGSRAVDAHCKRL